MALLCGIIGFMCSYSPITTSANCTLPRVLHSVDAEEKNKLC